MKFDNAGLKMLFGATGSASNYLGNTINYDEELNYGKFASSVFLGGIMAPISQKSFLAKDALGIYNFNSINKLNSFYSINSRIRTMFLNENIKNFSWSTSFKMMTAEFFERFPSAIMSNTAAGLANSCMPYTIKSVGASGQW